jgi:hypothetical protein
MKEKLLPSCPENVAPFLPVGPHPALATAENCYRGDAVLLNSLPGPTCRRRVRSESFD